MKYPTHHTIGVHHVVETRNTLIRALHDVGAAAWFGGSLMGAVAVNGASGDISDPAERAGIAADGWARWAPVSAVAIGAHLVGGLGLLLSQRGRVRDQHGVGANTLVKSALTGVALATTAYSGVLGAKIASAGKPDAASGTKPSSSTPSDVASSQQQLRALQWATPALTGAIIALGAQQGEQQRPVERLRGRAQKIARRSRDSIRQ